jgi:hypothetical protein
VESIRARVILAALAAVLVGCVAAIGVTDYTYRTILRSVTDESLALADRSFEAQRAARIDVMRSALAMLTQDPGIRNTFEKGDRKALQSMSWPFFEALRDEVNITRWYYYEAGPEGRVFLRVYRGDTALDAGNFGDAPKNGVLQRARQTGKTTSGIEVGASALAVRVVAPLRNTKGSTIGYIALGETIDEYLRVISKQTGADYAMFLDKKTMDHEQWRTLRSQQGQVDNWGDKTAVVLAASTAQASALLARAPDGGAQDGPRSLGVVRDGQSTFAAGTFPILDVSGKSVGFVYVVKDVTELAGLFRNVQLGLLLGFMLLAVVMSAVVVFVLQRLVFARLDTMIIDMEHMSLSVAAREWEALGRDREPRNDEIGAFERFFTTFIALIADALRSSANPKEPPER